MSSGLETDTDVESGRSVTCARSLATSWLPPVLPKETEFEVTIMYIDNEGQIYGQEKSVRKTVIEMEAKLTEIHSRLNPHPANWKNGDLCAVKFTAIDTGTWHRGSVVETHPNHLNVLFVDYGEALDVFPDRNECHKLIGMEQCLEIPNGCLRFKLHRITPKEGKYSRAFLDDMHKFIVEKKAKVEVFGDKTFPLTANIYLMDESGDYSIDLSQHFFNEG